MDTPFKFLLPSPSFDKKPNGGIQKKPHFLTPSGMTLLPREKQPPPMYGKRGATIPARYLNPVAPKEPVPEPIKQYCEPCEVELQSLEDYKRHRAQHEKCPVAGCQYKGHPTVMDKHITALHSTGLFEKFKKLCSPEEIAAWREERRKRFPTVENVLLKQKAQEQRQKRGERLEATRNRFGKIEDRKRAQPNAEDAKANMDNNVTKSNAIKSNKRNKNKNKRNRNDKRDRKDIKSSKDSSAGKTNASPQEINEASRHGPTEFRGTLQMKGYKHVNSKPKEKPKNALFGLVGMYGSDDESEDEQDNGEESEKTEETCQHVNEVKLQTIVLEDVVEITQKDTTTNEDTQKSQREEDNNKTVELLDKSFEGGITNNEQLVEFSLHRPAITNEINESSAEITRATISSCLLPPNTNTDNPSFSSHPTCLQKSNGNSSDEAPEETPIQRTIPDYQINADTSKTDNTPTSTSTQVQVHKQKNAAKQQPKENSKAKPILKRKSGLDYRKLKIRKQNTMLEKLLEADIRHERNVLLQCVRYVCENDFFGVGKKPSVG